MKIWMRVIKQVLPGVVFALSLSLSAHAAPIEKIRVVKISPMDEAAVVKVPGERELRLVKVGETLGDKGGVIKEIAEGRIVVEVGKWEEKDKVIIRTGKDGQKVERMRKKPQK
ncbi:MAG: hypothetical protein RQ824_05115 [bacterium]|nr:hypothetical protein [bacterium]